MTYPPIFSSSGSEKRAGPRARLNTCASEECRFIHVYRGDWLFPFCVFCVIIRISHFPFFPSLPFSSAARPAQCFSSSSSSLSDVEDPRGSTGCQRADPGSPQTLYVVSPGAPQTLYMVSPVTELLFSLMNPGGSWNFGGPLHEKTSSNLFFGTSIISSGAPVFDLNRLMPCT